MSLKYDALSYEWKKDKGLTNVTCGSTSLSVTCNLATALRALRHPASPKVLWADAICINQGDKEEKSKQIPLMRDIYATAKSVLIWLGPSFCGVASAFEVLPYLAMVGIERHPTGKPDTERLEDILVGSITERPKHGSIIQSQTDYLFVTHDRDSILWHTIKRRPELGDDAIFRFDDYEAWAAIDKLFGDPYFQRSWIIQEVAVAEAVYVVCGSHSIYWDIFRMAFEGRSKLAFPLPKADNATELQSYIPCVRDARLRYRDYKNPRCLDLGIVLTSFSYSKETEPRDRIYAALGIVKPPSLCQDIVPDYNKSIEEVFYEAASHIIRLRKDLYLWSNKTLMSRRTMPELPSWVPEWTMESCEEALEFARPEFSQYLSGNLAIQGNALFVNGYLLDEIDTIYAIKDKNNVFELVIKLEEWLKQRDKSMFGAYYSDSQTMAAQTMSGRPTASDRLREENNSETSQLLSRFQNVPPTVADIIHHTAVEAGHPLDNRQLNIEALWSTLTAVFNRRRKMPKPLGYHLFLAMLYMLPNLAWTQGNVEGGLPKGFSVWIMVAACLLLDKTELEILKEIFNAHFKRYDEFGYMLIEDRFFVTKKGIFGRAPAEAVNQGQVVVILGGAYVPYLLEKRESHYKLISHAYLEGMMNVESCPAGWKVDRIEIR